MNHAQDPQTHPKPGGMASLAEGVMSDVERLIGQHIDLLRSEVREQAGEAAEAATALGTGIGAAALASIFGGLAAVHFMHRNTRLPLWSCYAVVGGTLGALGGGLLMNGARQASKLQILPRRTAESVKRDVADVEQGLAWTRR